MNIYETFVAKPDELSRRFQLIREQGIPEICDKQFLADLGFKKPNSVLYIKLFKTLGLINEEGDPDQSLYPKFVKSEEQSKVLTAQLVKEKYAKVFEEHGQAHRLTEADLFSLFQKQMDSNKSKTIVKLVANTFGALAQYADWNSFENLNSSQTTKSMNTNNTQENNNTNPEKADTPHEEFILELMNGNSVHDYSKNGSVGVQEKPKEVNGVTEPDESSRMDEQIKKIVSNAKENGEYRNRDKADEKEHSIFLSKALIRRAELLEDMDRFEEAIKAYDEIINYSDRKRYPLGQENVTNAYYKKASMLEKMNKSEEALRAYDDFIQKFG